MAQPVRSRSLESDQAVQTIGGGRLPSFASPDEPFTEDTPISIPSLPVFGEWVALLPLDEPHEGSIVLPTQGERLDDQNPQALVVGIGADVPRAGETAANIELGDIVLFPPRSRVFAFAHPQYPRPIVIFKHSNIFCRLKKSEHCTFDA